MSEIPSIIKVLLDRPSTNPTDFAPDSSDEGMALGRAAMKEFQVEYNSAWKSIFQADQIEVVRQFASDDPEQWDEIRQHLGQSGNRLHACAFYPDVLATARSSKRLGRDERSRVLAEAYDTMDEGEMDALEVLLDPATFSEVQERWTLVYGPGSLIAGARNARKDGALVLYAVDGLFALGERSLVFGLKATFKTFLMLDIACSVATGTPWHGRAVTQGPAVLVLPEDSWQRTAARISAWHQEHPEASDPTPVVTTLHEPTNLLSDSAVAMFHDLVLQQQPKLIVIDNLRPCLGGRTANDDGAVSQAYSALNEAMKLVRGGCHCIVVHHANRDDRHEAGTYFLATNSRAIYHTKRPKQGSLLELHMVEANDEAPIAPIRLRSKAVGGSFVLTPASGRATGSRVAAGQSIEDQIEDEEEDVTQLILDLIGDNPGVFTKSEVLDRIDVRRAVASKRFAAMADDGTLTSEESQRTLQRTVTVRVWTLA